MITRMTPEAYSYLLERSIDDPAETMRIMSVANTFVAGRVVPFENRAVAVLDINVGHPIIDLIAITSNDGSYIDVRRRHQDGDMAYSYSSEIVSISGIPQAMALTYQKCVPFPLAGFVDGHPLNSKGDVKVTNVEIHGDLVIFHISTKIDWITDFPRTGEGWREAAFS